MRQVTGKTNLGSAANKVSIQLALDGHSFSLTGLPARAAAAAEEAPLAGDAGAPAWVVEVHTPRTLLVPEALFAPEAAALLLEADGKAPHASETIVHSRPADGMVAVMALPAAALEQLREGLGGETALDYTTPLLHALSPAKPTLLLQWVARYLYIKGWHAGLRLAEVLPAPTEADVLYALERLESEFQAKQYALRTAGARAKELAKLKRHLYPDTRCE